ncbi:acyltransferase [Vibrio cholerae]|uniref:acyltransferase family protein n=1 Tax=Vibrio cholerae TaxID=666 RepID=UPI0018F0EF82|nr:acyltransferase [Vibrio cholerae]EKG0038833.1 acyltransferase [Vibrio cholerae]ELE2133762.1 acyltransferase [Vibrio cholerae]MBJ6968697.1 acyltransferase [Vibrio cholerae]MCD6730709.1 acyltransferase [Vibrio cholerae]HEJ2462271.1 acyltransferase [Vibrio cholerae]
MKRFKVLDSFRGIAALMVAIYHLQIFGFISNANIVKNSYLFVEFFFVLSGFVICYSYEHRITNFSDLKSFMKKRIARIWPLHIFMTFLFIPFALANMFFYIDVGDRFSLFSLFTNLFLMQALNVNDGTTWNIPAWSISVELYTYFAFGILCVFLLRYNINRRLSYFLISIISVLVLYRYSDMGDAHHLAIFRCLYSFFLGALASTIFRLVIIKPWMEMFIVIMFLSVFILIRIDNDSWLSFLMPLFFFLVILVFSHQSGIVSRFLDRSLFEKLGMLSFSIYLTHTWFISSIKAFATISEKYLNYKFMYMVDGSRIIDFGISYFNDLFYIPYLIVVVIFSCFTYAYIELPWQRKIKSINFSSVEKPKTTEFKV